MKTSTRTAFGATALAVALVMIPLAAVGLSGCATSTDTTPAASGTANSQSESPKPSESAAAHQAGDVVTATTKLAAGQKAYGLATGTYVVVDAKQPIPDKVRADIVTAAAPVVASGMNPTIAAVGNRDGIQATMDFLHERATATGRPIVLVYSALSAGPNYGPMVKMWATLTSIGDIGSTGIPAGRDASPAKTVAAAQAFVDGQGGGDVILVQ